MPAGKGKDYLAAIESFKPSEEGDCLELTFKGIIGALNGEVKEGSSLYVFTDAKDPHQLVTARVLAMKIRLSIYFFTTGLCGSSEEGVLGFSVLRFWLFFRSVLRWRACVSNNARDFDLAMWNTYVDQFANYGFQLASRASNRRSSRTSRSNCRLRRVSMRRGAGERR